MAGVDPEKLAELMETLERLRVKVREMSARMESSAVALVDASERLGQFTRVFEEVAGIHAPRDVGLGEHCVTCEVPWPCPTAKALQELLPG